MMTEPSNAAVIPSKRIIGSLVAIFMLAKLALVSGHEIIASDTPHDDLWHILSAAGWYWWRPYSEWVLMHLPVYPLYVAFLQPTGFPLRLAIELTYLAGAAAVAFSLIRIGMSHSLVPLLFLIIAFHPYAVDVFDLARAETLYTCLMLFVVAAFICVLASNGRSSRIRWSIALALFTALAWHCRKESILLGVAFAVVAVVLVMQAAFRLIPRRAAMSFGLFLVVMPISAAMFLGALITITNGLRYGLWSTNELAAPNFVRALSALHEIAPSKPIWRVGVTREARMMAYRESPAFAELQPLLDGPDDRWFTRATREDVGLEHEIGSGWFHWALIWVAAEAGHYKTAADSEHYFERIADELSASLQSGRLVKRAMILPYVDPAVAVWLPHLPASIAAVARGVFLPSSAGTQRDQAELNPATVYEFDRMANRRMRDTERHRRAIDYLALWYATGSAIVLLCIVVVTVLAPSARPTRSSSALIVFAFIGALIVGRLLFFAIIDASAWNGVQARYLFPASVLVAPGVLAIGLLLQSPTPFIRGRARMAGPVQRVLQMRARS